MEQSATKKKNEKKKLEEKRHRTRKSFLFFIREEEGGGEEDEATRHTLNSRAPWIRVILRSGAQSRKVRFTHQSHLVFDVFSLKILGREKATGGRENSRTGNRIRYPKWAVSDQWRIKPGEGSRQKGLETLGKRLAEGVEESRTQVGLSKNTTPQLSTSNWNPTV